MSRRVQSLISLSLEDSSWKIVAGIPLSMILLSYCPNLHCDRWAPFLLDQGKDEFCGFGTTFSSIA